MQNAKPMVSILGCDRQGNFDPASASPALALERSFQSKADHHLHPGKIRSISADNICLKNETTPRVSKTIAG
jgi:hypothetical protein